MYIYNCLRNGLFLQGFKHKANYVPFLFHTILLFSVPHIPVQAFALMIPIAGIALNVVLTNNMNDMMIMS